MKLNFDKYLFYTEPLSDGVFAFCESNNLIPVKVDTETKIVEQGELSDLEIVMLKYFHWSWFFLMRSALIKKDEDGKEWFRKLNFELNRKPRKAQDIFPKEDQVYNVFNMNLFDVRCCIIGQSPYRNYKHSTGYAYAIPEHISKSPVSLENIEKAVGVVRPNLQEWKDQGVFLLNASLTSHKSGEYIEEWRPFIKLVLQTLTDNIKPVFLLTGRDAQSYKSYLINKCSVLESHIFETEHPAAPSYSEQPREWLYNDVFNRINKVLKSKIEWTLF